MELVICDNSLALAFALQYTIYFPSNVINSITLGDDIVSASEDLSLPLPEKFVTSAVREGIGSLQTQYIFGASLDLDLLDVEIDDQRLLPGLAVASYRAKPLAGPWFMAYEGLGMRRLLERLNERIDRDHYWKIIRKKKSKRLIETSRQKGFYEAFNEGLRSDQRAS